MQVVQCVGNKCFGITYPMFRLTLNLNIPTNKHFTILDVLGYLRECTDLGDNILPLIQQFQHR